MDFVDVTKNNIYVVLIYKKRNYYKDKIDKSYFVYLHQILAFTHQDPVNMIHTTQRPINFEMSFWCLQFLPKNERKQVNLRYHSSKVEFFRSIFGRVEDTKKSF